MTAKDVLLTAAFIIAVLIFLSTMLPPRAGSRSSPPRSVCASNLRGLLQAMFIYAADNGGTFPVHSFEATTDDRDPAWHGVSWVGAMGSSESLRVSQETSSSFSPRRGHPSRSLFLLVIGGECTQSQYICPSSGDRKDLLRNFGPDSTDEIESFGQPGRNRFDFSGYDALSYAYQLPFGPKAQPFDKLDARMVVVADKGPFTEDGGEGLARTRTRRDRLSGVQSMTWRDARSARDAPPEKWRLNNSRNHNGEGQNIGFADGHVEFQKRPIVGVDNDNIYTLARSASDPLAFINGYIPRADETIGPIVQTDSFLVP